MVWAMRWALGQVVRKGICLEQTAGFCPALTFAFVLFSFCFALPAGGGKDIELGDSFSWGIVQEIRRVLFNKNVLIIEWTLEATF